MATELLGLLEYIEEERGISREELIDALEKSLVSAGRKSLRYSKDLDVKIDRNTGKIRAWHQQTVVEEKDPANPEVISLAEARAVKADAQLGERITRDVPPEEFGRIAAQTAKQTMLQQLRKAEKSRVYDEFKDSIGTIVGGSVRRFEAGSVVVDFQKAEGVLSYKDKIPGDKFDVGDRLNALLVDVDAAGSGPSLILSRSHPNFVRRLFEREVAEIGEGVVQIKAIARDPGARTKIAVWSKDDRVDPIGACVGMRGTRVKSITAELGGERIDIIRFDADLRVYVANALQPAVPKSVVVNEEGHFIDVYVAPDQVRLAIGKNWQNVKLSGQLIGWKINIIGEEDEAKSFERQIERAVASLAENLNIKEDLAEKLVKNGFLTVEGLKEAGLGDIAAIDGVSEDEAKQVLAALALVG